MIIRFGIFLFSCRTWQPVADFRGRREHQRRPVWKRRYGESLSRPFFVALRRRLQSSSSHFIYTFLNPSTCVDISSVAEQTNYCPCYHGVCSPALVNINRLFTVGNRFICQKPFYPVPQSHHLSRSSRAAITVSLCTNEMLLLTGLLR